MGYVTKTQSGYVGEVTEIISFHFESFDDFLKYEQMTSTAVDEQAGVVNIVKESPTTEKKPLKKLEIGKEYRIIKELHGHGFYIGEVVRVTDYGGGDVEDASSYIATHLDGSNSWWIHPEEVEEV